jgi:hypothetical protein
MHPSLYLMALGVALSVASWVWFRLPGKAFWKLVPIWRSSEWLRPAGVWLWIAGTIVGFIGLGWAIQSGEVFA